jgi:uncharacterized LabA/DUF88 family protein
MAFVDAGYLTAGALKQLKLPSAPRIDGDELSAWARSAWTSRRGGDVLRTYVYDAQYPADATEYPEQRAYFDGLGAQLGIRVRLGHLVKRSAGTRRAAWEQKGVDTLLVLDLLRLAQHGAFDTALIIVGDRDLAEAIRVIADDYARRVVLYSVEGSAPAKELVQLADDHGIIGGHSLRSVIGQKAAASNPPVAPVDQVAPEARQS